MPDLRLVRLTTLSLWVNLTKTFLEQMLFGRFDMKPGRAEQISCLGAMRATCPQGSSVSIVPSGDPDWKQRKMGDLVDPQLVAD